MGKVLKDMDAVDYHEFKQELLPKIKEVYQELDQEYDAIILEGAGSPAEINLNERDIVNMGMARLVDAPVILVADIDKGGVLCLYLWYNRTSARRRPQTDQRGSDQ